MPTLLLLALASGLSVGDRVPLFTAQADDGQLWSSVQHVGQGWTVLYFYPADMTGGCTKQACGFRDNSEQLREAGVTVVGVSGDSVASHKLFKKVHDLDFTLLSDPNGKIAEMFGVPYRKGTKSITRSIDGVDRTLTRTATIQRWTFLIDPDGRIAEINAKVEAAADSDQVLQMIKAREAIAN